MDPISNPSTDARSLASLVASATAVAPRASEPLVTDRYKLEERPLERRGFRFGDTFTRDRREEVDAFTRLAERLRRAASLRRSAEPVEQPPSPSALAPAAGPDLASPIATSSGSAASSPPATASSGGATASPSPPADDPPATPTTPPAGETTTTPPTGSTSGATSGSGSTSGSGTTGGSGSTSGSGSGSLLGGILGR